MKTYWSLVAVFLRLVTWKTPVSEQNKVDTQRSDICVTVESSTSASSAPCSDYNPIDYEDAQNLLSSLFHEKDKLHNRIKCQDKCWPLSSTEVQRLSGQKDKFQHDWLKDKNLSFCPKTGIWWLAYVEGSGMFCVLCKKYNCVNTQNKCSSFGENPSVRMKKSALYDHVSSKKHQSAIESEMLNRVSVFQKELTEKGKVENTVLFNAFYAMYWLAKEGVASVKIITLLNLMEKLGLHDMKYFQHRSRASLRETFNTIGQEVECELLAEVKNADFFSILLDDSSDVSSIEQMICYIQFWNGTSCDTKFLFIENILANASSANAETLYNLVKHKLTELNLDINKLSGISTDGASVMVGKREGLVAKLSRDVPSLVAIHCICHRLALACIDTNNHDLVYIKEVESHITHVWKIFHYSPVKLAALLKAQTELHKMNLSGKTTKLLTKTMKKACQTRWLSFDNAVQSLFQELVAVVQTLNMFSSDATAYGLMKKITSLRFSGTLYVLQRVLPILSGLSQHFQKGNVNFTMISPALDNTKFKLNSLSKEEIFSSLAEDLSSSGRLFVLNVQVSEFILNQLKSNMSKYIDALCKNIDERFKQSPLMASFAVFDPRSLPERESIEFPDYGKQEIHTLADHFFPGNEEAKEQMIAEWGNFKFNLLSWKTEIPSDVLKGETDDTSLEWILKKMLVLKGSMCHFFPHLVKVGEIILTLPVSNAWPERGFSRLKLVKTGLRNRMQNDMLQSLLQISLNGPALYNEHADQLIKGSVSSWLKGKQRRTLPKCSNINQNTAVTSQAVVPILTESSTQTEAELDLSYIEKEYEKAIRVLQLAKYAQKVADIESIEDDFSDSEEYDEINDQY